MEGEDIVMEDPSVKKDRDQKKCDEQVFEQPGAKMDESDNSSLLFKDSAYGSLGHSASSSMGPIIPPTGIFNHLYPHISQRSHTPSTTPSSRSGGSSLVNSQSSSTVALSSIGSNQKQHIDPPKIRVSASSRKKIKSNLDKIKEKEKGDEQPSFLSSKDCKAAKVATLSQALGYVDQFRKSQAAKSERLDKEDEIKTLVTNLTEVCQGSKVTTSQREEINQSLSQNQLEQGSDNILDSGASLESDGFCVAVSMNNGMVVHTTPSLTSVLGYPKDMWIGRSIIDFVHPKDREYFISQVTDNINLPMEKIKSPNIRNKSRNFFCRIRMYSGLKSGFAVKERKKKFRYFKMCVCFSEVNSVDPNDTRTELGEVGIYLFITAIPLATPYKAPHEEGPIKITPTNRQGVFATKHNAGCSWTFLDEDSVSLLGHFPHELEGSEIFDIIHPQDLNIVKESFESMVFSKNCKSNPYRIKTRNLDYVTVVTSWSCFVNPWNQQLEFIHGRHTIVKGPKNPNIFSEPPYEEQQEKASDDKVKVTSIIQDDIKLILQNYVRKNQISKMTSGGSTESKKKLSSFMGTLLQEVAKAESFELSRSTIHGAVVIGNISPHQSDSSESPPSYNQLTYNENLTRFFNSQPKTLSEKDIMSGIVYSSPSSYEDNPKEVMKALKSKKEQRKSKGSGGGTGEDGSRSQGGSGQGSGDTQQQQGSGTGQTVSGSGEDNAKNSSSLQIGLSAGHIQLGAEECIMSQDGCTSGSGSRLGSGSREGVDTDYKPPLLTEDLLVLHNREMEKQMVSKFREAKRIGELGFLKEGKNKIDQSESKKVLVSKNKGKNEVSVSGTTKRQHLSTIPEIPNHSVSHSQLGQQEGGPAQEYQRPLAFTDSHFSSYSGTSTPNIFPTNQSSRQGPEGPGAGYQMPMGPFIQGSVAEDGSQKYIQRDSISTQSFSKSIIMEVTWKWTSTMVPAIMIPITCANTNPSQVFPHNMPMMMMQGTPTGFIPLCMGEPVLHPSGRGFMYKVGAGEQDQDGAAMRPGMKPSTSRQTAATTQFELPNCLAVNSCMTHRESVKEQESGAKKTEKRDGMRPPSGDGSRHTSVKGEPGSALESNASAGEPVKSRNPLVPSPIGPKQQTKQIGEELCSSSQSLYSFLPSSDDNDIADFLQGGSSKPDDSEGEDKVKSVRQVARPVLSEPFWNEGVVMSETLMKTYQMEEEDTETVLKRDMERLARMKQPEALDSQLMELKGFIEVVEEFDIQNLFADNEEEDDEDVTDTTSPDEGEKDDTCKKKKRLRRLKNLEKLNMFMEENAPFPEKLSPSKQLDSAGDCVLKQDDSDLKGDTSDEAVENPSSLVEAFKITVGRAGPSRVDTSDFQTFTSTRPQAGQFQYGKGMATNLVTKSQPPKGGKLEPAVTPTEDLKVKDSTDETESSEEVLKTSSSVKSSSGEDQGEVDNQKRKKGVSSPESVSSIKKPEDKKLKFGCDSPDNTTDSEGHGGPKAV